MHLVTFKHEKAEFRKLLCPEDVTKLDTEDSFHKFK